MLTTFINTMGNVASLIPAGIRTCDKSKCGNDDASATAIFLITITVAFATIWQLCGTIRMYIKKDSIVSKNDETLGLLFAGIGISLTISTCYPQQITAGAYTNAFCGALIMYDYTTINNYIDLLNGIPSIIAIALNATVIWYAASSWENGIYARNVNLWGSKEGNPKTITIVTVVAISITLIFSLVNGIAQINNTGGIPTKNDRHNKCESIKLNRKGGILREPVQSPSLRKRVLTQYGTITVINIVYSLIIIIFACIHASFVWSLFAHGPNNVSLGCDATYPNSSIYVSNENYYKACPIMIISSMALNILNIATVCYRAVTLM